MSAYPTEPKERESFRKKILDRELARARREAQIKNRTVKCGGWDGTAPPRHAGEPGGCRNDGSNCICECHG